MTQKYQVNIVEAAEKDLYNIYTYVATHDSELAANKLLDKLEAQCIKLAMLPERGNHPRELVRIGIADYREIHIKPYRIVYQILNNDVYIHGVLDGRRDLEDHLLRRLVLT